jgi:hypothetical protein
MRTTRRTDLLSRPAFWLLTAALVLAPGLYAAKTRQQTQPAPAPAAPVVRTCQAYHVNPGSPVIDGKLDDEVWQKHDWEDGFIQGKPYEGRDPSEKTSFKVLYDEKALYVAVRALDSEPGKIERRLSRRDQREGDTVTVAIDSMYDRLTAFVFTVNAAGVKSDRIMVNDGVNFGGGEPDMSWDPIWDAAAAKDDQGWTAEMRIPFSQLRFGNKAEQVWGFDVWRTLFRKDETSYWQLIPRNASGFVHLFGDLRGLVGLKAPHQVELMPYTVGDLQSFRAEPGNPFAKGTSTAFRMGLDGKVGVTSDLTMNFTINPDFGQVEADPSVVNLTAFETYFQEKRPFFVEGRNIFNYQLMNGDGDFSDDNVFYSRRIGRYPQYSPSVDGYLDVPQATTILGAFKLTGKTRSGLSIGILDGLTSRETAGYFDGAATSEIPVEPFTNYLAARVQQDFNGGTTIVGGMVTAVNRNLGDSELSFLHGQAYTGGVDFYHTWDKKNWFLSFKAVASRVQGTPEAIFDTQTSPVHYFQRPDADYLTLDPTRTSLSGSGGDLEFGKIGGGHWLFMGGVTWRSPGLELNDVGYLRQSDAIMQFFWTGYQWTEPFGPFRSANIGFNEWAGWDFGGENIFKGGDVNFFVNLKNYWAAGAGVNFNLSGLSQTALRGGPLFRTAVNRNIWFDVETDTRQKVRLELMGSHSARLNGDSNVWDWQPGLTIVPSSALQLTLMPLFETNRSKLQYVATPAFEGQDRYVLGTIDQKTLGLTVRLNYSLSPDLSIQLYAMPFISAGKYGDFKRVTDARARDYAQRYALFGSALSYDEAAGQYSVDENGDGTADYAFDNPDFNFRQFRSNLVIRWEYVPGSTLYLVWSQGRTGSLMNGAFDLGRDLGGLFDVHPDNVFLVKFSYCFQL